MDFDKNILTNIVVGIENDGSEVTRIEHLGNNVFRIDVTTDPGDGFLSGSGYTADYTYQDEVVKKIATHSVWMR